MKLEDFEKIAHLHGLIAKEPQPGFAKLLKAHMADEDCAGFVAEFEGNIVGFMIGHLVTLSLEQEKSAWIAAMGVDPGFIEQDIGVELAAQILRYFEGRGISAVHTCLKWNDGGRLSLFKALGFKRSQFINLTKKL